MNKNIRLFLATCLPTLLISFFSSCKSPETPKAPPYIPPTISKVELQGALVYKDPGAAYGYFQFTGTVVNSGNVKARLVRIYITVYDGSGNTLATEWNFVDLPDMDVGAISGLTVIFADSGRAMRKVINPDKSTYKIEWDQ